MSPPGKGKAEAKGHNDGKGHGKNYGNGGKGKDGKGYKGGKGYDAKGYKGKDGKGKGWEMKGRHWSSESLQSIYVTRSPGVHVLRYLELSQNACLRQQVHKVGIWFYVLRENVVQCSGPCCECRFEKTFCVKLALCTVCVCS